MSAAAPPEGLGPTDPTGTASTEPAGAPEGGDAAAGEARAQTPAWKLLVTLAFSGAVAGLLIVIVYLLTLPRIRAHEAAVLRAGIEQVLNQPNHYQTLYVVNGHLTPTLPAGADSSKADQVYLGFDAAGRPVGFAVPAQGAGFQDIIKLIFGYDAQKDVLLGMMVTQSNETPGLGARITSDSSFIKGFVGVSPPLLGVKTGTGEDKKHDVDMITGSTISSRAVITIINTRLKQLKPLLQAYNPTRKP